MGAKKKNSIWIIILVIAACFFLAPIVTNLIFGGNYNQNGTSSNVDEVRILEDKIEWAQDEEDLHLLGGTIRTNVEIEKIFVNVEDIGVQDLTYTVSIVETANAMYATYTLKDTCCICATVWGSDTTVRASIYVQLNGRVYLVDTQTVAVSSCWTPVY